MLVKEMDIDGTHVEFYDDCLATDEEEKKEILQRASDIIWNALETMSRKEPA